MAHRPSIRELPGRAGAESVTYRSCSAFSDHPLPTTGEDDRKTLDASLHKKKQGSARPGREGRKWGPDTRWVTGQAGSPSRGKEENTDAHWNGWSWMITGGEVLGERASGPH
jgi:hypothetical protein